ncbi:MAG: hypothetical protein J6Z12_05585 [Paludibacteraceae bacterium]|nr:hypothetical protein [Paludibacteraceae bacterium]
MKKFILTGITLLASLLTASAGWKADEARIARTFEALYAAGTDSARSAVNQTLRSQLATVLQQDSAFDYPFADIRQMGKVMSNDANLRIISWNYRQDNGTYGYEAFILRKHKGKILVKNLSSNEGFKPKDNVVYNAKNWYGSLYYNIFAIKGTYYLLGYSTYNDITKIKVIEVLSWNGNELQLGAPLFADGKKNRMRKVFEYSAKAQMSIQYDAENNRFVFDHLSPSEPALKGLYQYYGPDFSYEALSLKKKRWMLEDDVDVKNPMP